MSDDGLAAAMAALWRDARPRMVARVAAIDEAAAALGRGELDDDVVARARDEAHKLAGALGTFGIPRGSDRARAVEQRLRGAVVAADAADLAEHARVLRALVDDGPPATREGQKR